MSARSRELIDLARHAQRSDAPLRELAELLLRIRNAPGRSVHAAAVERILAATPELAREQAWAAGMQLGAEGFDNTMSARAYSDVHACLVEAGRSLARACEILLEHD
jgi:hypothetical protein